MKKTKRKRSLNQKWLQAYEWLKYDEEAGSMTGPVKKLKDQ